MHPAHPAPSQNYNRSCLDFHRAQTGGEVRALRPAYQHQSHLHQRRRGALLRVVGGQVLRKRLTYTSNTTLLLQAIPYAADIPGNFYPGRKLYVSALAKNRAKQFTIDFHSGEEIACRVNPRFPAKVWENYIVRTMA